MIHRFHWRAGVGALVLLLLVAGGTALAKSSKQKSPKKATVEMAGRTTFKLNGFIKDSVHFRPGLVVIKSGGSLTLKNKTDEPHTFSIVNKGDQPRSLKDVGNCGSPGTICDKLFSAHQPDANGNPTKPVVDVGTPGVDEPGDSFVLNPKQTMKANVSAAKGKTLYFMCGIHAWMQGSLKVR
jgi:hypothetical protein